MESQLFICSRQFGSFYSRLEHLMNMQNRFSFCHILHWIWPCIQFFCGNRINIMFLSLNATQQLKRLSKIFFLENIQFHWFWLIEHGKKIPRRDENDLRKRKPMLKFKIHTQITLTDDAYCYAFLHVLSAIGNYFKMSSFWFFQWILSTISSNVSRFVM